MTPYLYDSQQSDFCKNTTKGKIPTHEAIVSCSDSGQHSTLLSILCPSVSTGKNPREEQAYVALCIFRLLLFSAQGFLILMRFSYLVISRGQFLQVFVQLPVDIMQILCTASSSKLSHRSITCQMENHPLQLVLNLPLMSEHDGLSSHFWQRTCTANFHVVTTLSSTRPSLSFFLRLRISSL